MTLDATMKVWRMSHLIPELNGIEKRGMGSAYCDGMCKNPHAIKLVKMAAMDLQRRDPIEAKWGGICNFLDKELCMQSYGKGEGRGILFSSCI